MTLREEHVVGLDWQRDALCIEYPDLDWFTEFPRRGAPAKAVCARCLVKDECLAWALEREAPGIWGGTSALERRHLLGARPMRSEAALP